MGGQHRPYTRQFREQAVKLVVDGQEPTRTARELGMPHSTLLVWLHKAGWRKPEPDGAVIGEDPAVLKAQIRELRRRLRRSEVEKDILKKATAYFASLKSSGSRFVHRRRGEFPVTTMCRILNVTRSGYYAWRDRPACARDERRVRLIGRIRQVHRQSRCTYGSPRITAELKEQGTRVSENTVARYMREAGVTVRPRRRFVPLTTDSGHGHPVAPNVLDRDFAAAAPDQKWACDLTYVFTEEGWLYLSVVIDLFSRRVVGWSMSDGLEARGVAEALEMAVARRMPAAGLLHHSDRGVQYACQLYRTLIAGHGIECSMSRPGNCYDNAVAESFFGTLKSELVHRTRYRTRQEARTSIFEWIECWYNRRRRHSSLGYLSPEAFEARIN